MQAGKPRFGLQDYSNAGAVTVRSRDIGFECVNYCNLQVWVRICYSPSRTIARSESESLSVSPICHTPITYKSLEDGPQSLV